MAQKKPVTAANPIARLNADPEFVARRDRADAELEAKEAEWRLAEAPLIEELTAAGFHVESAWDFVNTADSYEEALPILVAHVQRPTRVILRRLERSKRLRAG